jgi:hypothetical protein
MRNADRERQEQAGARHPPMRWWHWVMALAVLAALVVADTPWAGCSGPDAAGTTERPALARAGR